MDPVALAVAKAREAAANIVEPSTVPAIPATSSSVSVLDYVTGDGLTVDSFVKVSNVMGMVLSTNPTVPFKECFGTIALNQIKPCESIRYSSNGAVIFETTYDVHPDLRPDQRFSKRGEPWSQVLEKVQKLDPKARPYRSADVPLTLTKPIVVNGEVLIEEGSVLGFSMSITNFKYFREFINTLREKKVSPNAVVPVRAYHRVNENVGKPKNGVVVFELLQD